MNTPTSQEVPPQRSGAREVPVLPLLTRHAVQVLVRAGHTHAEVAAHTSTSERTVRRIAGEAEVAHVDDAAERATRGLGRPSKAEPCRQALEALLAKEPELMTLEVLRRMRLHGYTGSKSPFYALVAELRPKRVKVECHFEGLAGEFSQHDFGQVDVRFVDDSVRRVQFFASRLKFSRWAEVTIVEDQRAETLVRTLLDHFVAFGGMPLCAVFDRPKTVALEWQKDGKVTTWNPIFAAAAMDIGFAAEACWPYQPQQKGAVEKLVGWVKSSFFKQRRFLDMTDLHRQLAEWLGETNGTRPSRATSVPPSARIAEERARFRAPRTTPDQLALRFPVSVGPTAEVVHDCHAYLMPPEAAGLPGTLYLYRDRVRIVAGRHERSHRRGHGREGVEAHAVDRASRLAAVCGKRGKAYQKRQDLVRLGDAAVRFISELVHRRPRDWYGDVDRLHALLQDVGPNPLVHAIRSALDANRFSTAHVAECLGRRPPQTPLFQEFT